LKYPIQNIFKENLFKSIPQIISVILHPLLMPTYGLVVIFNSGTYLSFLPIEFKKSIFLIVGICTLGIPLILIPFYLYRKIISGVEMNSINERIIPLVITSILYYASFYILNNTNVPGAIRLFLLGATLCVIVTLIISIQWKISAHMIGLGGMIGLILSISVLMHSDMLFYLILFIFLSGITASARLILNSHTPTQVYIGFVVGFLIMSLTLFIF
jgi:hypothetical protein